MTMTVRTVGIGEWSISSDPASILKTLALGSCVAVVVYDRARKLGGLLHVALPDSSIGADQRVRQPGYFADRGLPLMIEEMKALGARRSSVWIKLAGGATMLDPGGRFDIGKRNVLAIRRILWRSGLGPIAEDIGGEISRTVSLSIEDGATSICSGDRRWAL